MLPSCFEYQNVIGMVTPSCCKECHSFFSPELFALHSQPLLEISLTSCSPLALISPHRTFAVLCISSRTGWNNILRCQQQKRRAASDWYNAGVSFCHNPSHCIDGQSRLSPARTRIGGHVSALSKRPLPQLLMQPSGTSSPAYVHACGLATPEPLSQWFKAA